MTEMRGTSGPKCPHFAFPFQHKSGGVNVVEQGTEQEIMGCENVIVRTPLGARVERPEFGWPWPIMRQMPVDTNMLLAALKTFEPRANPSAERLSQLVHEGRGEASINVNLELPVNS